MERDDLGALFGRVVRRLIAAERPLLEAHGLTMWEYSVLTHLAKQPTETQQALAAAIGYDKSRLIPLLDGLAGQGLLVREPDPANRRAHAVRLTPDGLARLEAARADIRAMEEELLSVLSAAEQRHLLAVLPRLAD
ncbi:MarR family transcriptional regulator [Kribbella sp. NPDC051770]|uniref:MarR family winged helix-turn-helix transcriptional regulator n=1 Tax=Kribbella sp. NPDC051770 TaxID=3155413 RepID=UPI00343AE3B2